MRQLVGLGLVCMATILCGQRSNETTLLSVNEGLSQGMIFDIHQSQDGFIWIATKDGLNRYDGYQFQVFTNDPFNPFSIITNEVWRIFEDSRGWLWLICPDGLDLFLPLTGRFFHILSDIPGLVDNIFSFVEMPDDTVWITANGKCWRIEVSPSQVEQAAQVGNAFPGLPWKEIQLPEGLFSTIFLTEKGNLLTGSTQGLFQIDKTTNALQQRTLSGKAVKIIGQDKQGRIWIDAVSSNMEERTLEADCGGLWLWEEAKASLRPIPCLPSGRYQLMPDGSLWTWQVTNFVFHRWEPEVFVKGGTPNLIWKNDPDIAENKDLHARNISFDRSGIGWMGTNGFGVLKTNFAQRKFSSPLTGTSIRQITADPQGNLFIIGSSKLFYTTPQAERILPNPWAGPLKPNDDQSLTVFDEQGNAWINTALGTLFRVDAQDKTYRSLPWTGLGIIRSRNGKLLSVQVDGLVQLDPLTEQRRLFPFDSPLTSPQLSLYSHFLYEDPLGTVWIFAYNGLIEAVPNGDGYQYSFHENAPANVRSISTNRVLSVAADPLEPGHYLWVGTEGGGLNRLDRTDGSFTHFKTEQGLPNNVVYGILPDEHGHIWLSTNRGLCRFHVRENTTRNFTAADGLPSNEFNRSSYLRTRDGHLIFGGVNGLTVFHPDSLKFNKHIPLTQIVGLEVNNETIGNLRTYQNSNLTLSYQQNLLTFDFAALEFSNPSQNKYRYQLIRNGLLGKKESEKWVDLREKNTIQFANLSPGSYTFKVLGSNNDGLWSEQPAVLSFTIRPPWWASWWAYLGYALVLGSLSWIFYRYQIRRKLEYQENLRLKELDDFKNRFFTNITHEFRTPLTVILGTTERLNANNEHLGTEDRKGSLSLIKRNGEGLLHLINQLLDLAKLESKSLKINYVQGDILPYLRYIAESLHSLANAQNVMLRVESEQAKIVMDYDPERLLQIIYNLLSNAIKFTPSGGKVTLRADSTMSSLYLTVIDTGVGIPSEDLPHIFDRFFQANNLKKAKAGGTGIGLALTKELVNTLGGEITVESKGAGTTFKIQLPITNKAVMMNEISLEPTALMPVPKPANRPKLAASVANGERSHLLIIEDNPDVVEYLVACLGEHYLLDFAYNGRAGIEKALETIPDLIVSDVMMPEKDGFEVCEALKTNEFTSHIPIVLLTAKAGVENRIAGLRKGADAYLSKPFHQEELLVVLQNLLELRRKLQAKYGSWEIEKTTNSPISELPNSTPPDPEGAFIQKVHAAILERLSDPKLSVDELSQDLAMSQSQLLRKLKALTGKNTTLFIRSIRLARAKELLQGKTMNVSETAYEVGFDDPKYFSRVFKEEFGIAPSEA